MINDIMPNLQVSRHNFSNSKQMDYFEIKSNIVTVVKEIWTFQK